MVASPSSCPPPPSPALPLLPPPTQSARPPGLEQPFPAYHWCRVLPTSLRAAGWRRWRALGAPPMRFLSEWLPTSTLRTSKTKWHWIILLLIGCGAKLYRTVLLPDTHFDNSAEKMTARPGLISVRTRLHWDIKYCLCLLVFRLVRTGTRIMCVFSSL